MKIYLVRHGESASDVQQKYNGDYDDHLTKKGREEAEEIARKLLEKGIQRVFSSSRIRAIETAEIVCSILKCGMEVTDNLNEQDIYGAYPGLSIDQPEEEYRRLGELIADRNIQIAGVETYQELKARVAEEFLNITHRPYRTIAVITHGGPIRSIIRDILKRGELTEMKNGSIIELERHDPELKLVSIEGAILQNPI